MNPQRQKLVEEIFLAAIEAGDGGAGAVVEARCGSDVELRAEVMGLLGCHQSTSEGVLDRASPVGQSLLGGIDIPPPGELPLPPSGKIAHYKVVRVLGAGGMGAVYVGQQERPKRTVALKVIRPGYATAQVLRRMEHEADLLARLQHPGIAQIYEAGTADPWGHGQQPYFAMELVDGPTITDYATRNGLSVRQRLAMMVKVADAVQHAHQRGVIHRDIKPANILIGQDGQPKVLDFGVARTTGSDVYATTLQTSVGQMIGTLPYMSPEQVAADPDQIDTRTDVYALGVVLHELLAGRLPHDLSGKSIPEAARIIRDETPPRLGSLRRELRGDTETIVAKAMDKDKARRYQSAAALADDLRRCLAGEPIAAKRDSAVYVLSKTIARNRTLAAMIGLLAMLVLGFGVYAALAASQYKDLATSEGLERQRADGALALARSESEKNQALNTELRSRLQASIIERGRLEATADNGRAAEGFLWPALLANPADESVRFALRELFDRSRFDWATFVGSGVAIAADHGLVAASSRPGVLALLDAQTGVLLASAPQPETGPVLATRLMFIGPRTLLAGTADGTIRVYDATPAALTEVHQWLAHVGQVDACTIAPDDSWFATTGSDGTVAVWELPGCTLRWHRKHTTSRLTSLAVTPDGQSLLIGNNTESRVIRIDARTGDAVQTYSPPSPTSLGLLVASDGRSFFTGGFDRRVAGIDLATGGPAPGLGFSRGDVRDLHAVGATDLGQDSYVVVGLLSARLVSMAPWAQSRQIAFDEAGIIRSAYHRGRLYTAGADGVIRAWDARPAPSQTELRGGFGSWVFSVEFSPDGQTVLAGSGDSRIRAFDPRSGELKWEIGVSGVPVKPGDYQSGRSRALRYLDAETFASGSSDGRLRLHNAVDGTLKWAPPQIAGASEIYDIDPSPDGTLLAVAHGDRTVRVWNIPQRTLAWQVKTTGSAIPRGVAFSHDGTRLYVGDTDGVSVIVCATQQREGLIRTSATPWSVAASADGRFLAVGTLLAGVDIIDLATGTRLGGPSGHLRVVAAVTFSPDSKILLSAGDDGTVRLWDAQTARLLSSIDFNAGEAPTVAIDPEGRLLAVGCQGRFAAVRDIYYHDRHIALNLEEALLRYKEPAPSPTDVEFLRRWARGVLMRAGLTPTKLSDQ